MEVPAAVCSVPAAHETCGVHETWFIALAYVPVGHDEHKRLVVALPAVLMYSPAAHVVHAAQAVAFDVLL